MKKNGAKILNSQNFGYEGGYKCSRNGTARVLVDGKQIGTIDFTMIDRECFLSGRGISFWEACDAESAELETIASQFFKPNGSLKPTLTRRLKVKNSNASAHGGYFMYIKAISLDAPYDRTATDENARVGAIAISKLIRSPAMWSDNGMTSLVMYAFKSLSNPC